ncbi:hypothetical protein SUGI_0299590 [Cryptomeria japonica]|nr:hypothetical protein SUGI_0299590 [Cryptomeria japonica]
MDLVAKGPELRRRFYRKMVVGMLHADNNRIKPPGSTLDLQLTTVIPVFQQHPLDCLHHSQTIQLKRV